MSGAPQHRPPPPQRGAGRAVHGLRGVVQRGHAQVDDLDLRRQLGRGGGRGRVAEDHVLGLDVAVHDAVAVHVRDRLRQLRRAARARASGALPDAGSTP